MSLSARVALVPSRRVACAEQVVPLVGLAITATTVVVRWPQAAMVVLPAACLVALLIAARAWRLRPAAEPYRFTLSERPEFGLMLPAGDSLDARLVESTLVWPGFWMIAWSGAGDPRIVRLAVLPADLHCGARRSLSRFPRLGDPHRRCRPR